MEYYQNQIAIPVPDLVAAGVFTLDNYKNLKKRNRIESLRRGGGADTPALVAWESLPDRFKEVVKEKIGDPAKIVRNSYFTKFIKTDEQAFEYFRAFRKPDGKPLDPEKQKEYCANAEIYQAISLFVNDVKAYRRARGASAKGVWQRVADAVNNLDAKKYPHSLPGNPKTIERNLRKFKSHGYESLVHGGVGNSNPTKIEGEVAEWLLAYYCLPNKPLVTMAVDAYNEVRALKGWPEITESAVSIWLNKPEVRRQWFLARHGKDAYMNEYAHHLKRDREHWFPNAWWAIDGTKLDWVHYYDNDLGMAAKLKINVMFDVYSEKIIGWSYSETESHVDHFKALKMAANVSGHKPYLLTYDNQSGHKSARMQKLYSQVVATGGTHYPHKAYKKSNPVEQMFNRLQQQVISRFWFSDKQTIKARNIDNTPNIDFLKANKHQLYSLEDLQKAWELVVDTWNNERHPRFKEKTRNEVFSQEAPISHKISDLDQVEMFWIDDTKGSEYRRGGIKIRVDHKEYEFEVYDQNDRVDLEFRRLNVGRKFIVRYDPETLDQFVGLYEQSEGGLMFIAYAQPKRAHETIPALMTPGEKEAWREDYLVSEIEYERDLRAVEALRAKTGIAIEKMIEEQDLMIKMGGKLTKEKRNEVEAGSFLNRL